MTLVRLLIELAVAELALDPFVSFLLKLLQQLLLLGGQSILPSLDVQPKDTTLTLPLPSPFRIPTLLLLFWGLVLPLRLLHLRILLHTEFLPLSLENLFADFNVLFKTLCAETSPTALRAENQLFILFDELAWQFPGICFRVQRSLCRGFMRGWWWSWLVLHLRTLLAGRQNVLVLS